MSDDPIMYDRAAVDGLLIMGSDGHPDYPPALGDTMAIALSGINRARLSKASSWALQQIG